jgi:C-terminal processing protease CtpA/Prc
MRRAVIVGERTRGGAHLTSGFRIDEHFRIAVPHARSENAITGTDWEGVGVKPDVEVPAERALHTAHLMALRTLAARPGRVFPALADERRRAIEALEALPSGRSTP